jgi:hypothetical protein
MLAKHTVTQPEPPNRSHPATHTPHTQTTPGLPAAGSCSLGRRLRGCSSSRPATEGRSFECTYMFPTRLNRAMQQPQREARVLSTSPLQKPVPLPARMGVARGTAFLLLLGECVVPSCTSLPLDSYLCCKHRWQRPRCCPSPAPSWSGVEQLPRGAVASVCAGVLRSVGLDACTTCVVYVVLPRCGGSAVATVLKAWDVCERGRVCWDRRDASRHRQRGCACLLRQPCVNRSFIVFVARVVSHGTVSGAGVHRSHSTVRHVTAVDVASPAWRSL